VHSCFSLQVRFQHQLQRALHALDLKNNQRSNFLHTYQLQRVLRAPHRVSQIEQWGAAFDAQTWRDSLSRAQALHVDGTQSTVARQQLQLEKAQQRHVAQQARSQMGPAAQSGGHSALAQRSGASAHIVRVARDEEVKPCNAQLGQRALRCCNTAGAPAATKIELETL
jgi:hypothetical protein